jgi:fructokinase
MARIRIGIDVGGTKIEAIALSRRGDELGRVRIATPRDYDGTIAAITDLVSQLEQKTSATGSVGVGIPGALVPTTGLVKNANSVWLNGRPLAHDLERALNRPVRLMNDANCFALSEATDGAAAGAATVFGVILGTGAGGGIVLNGRCHAGANLIAGEWGHNPLPWPVPNESPGPLCYCGKRGCVETWISGPAFERDYAEHTGETRSSREIVEAATRGDARASATLARYHERLARSLATVVNLLDPDVIVLGGGMSNIDGLPEAAAAALAGYVFSAGSNVPLETRIVRHVHGDSSGVRGAAWLWPNEG